LRLLPDGLGVVTIDIQSVTSSDLWTSLSQKAGPSKSLGEIQADLATLGLKLSDLKSAALAIPASQANGVAAVINGSFSQDDLLSHIRDNAKVKLSQEPYKGATVYRVDNAATKKEEASFTFYDAGTIVMGSATGVRAAIDVRAGEKPSLAQNEKLSGAMTENGSAAIRFAFAPTAGMTGGIHSSTIPLPDFTSVNLIFGTVGISSGIDLNATLRNDTAEHAKAMANQLNGLLAMARGFLGSSSNAKNAPLVDAIKNITITDSNADVKISGNLPKEALAQIIH